MEINLGAYESLTLSSKLAITAATVSGVKGTYSGNGAMELCLPPYLETQVANIEVVVKTVNGDWGTAKVTASVGSSTQASGATLANSLIFESSLPTLYFNHFSEDDVDVRFTLSSTMTGLSSYVSYTASKKF